MSASGRRRASGEELLSERRGEAFYPTPREAIDPIAPHLLPALLTARRIVELGAGDGAIVRALLDLGVRAERIVAVEKEPALAARCRALGVRCDEADALTWEHEPLPEGHVADVVMGNPPYGIRRKGVKYVPLALPFVRKALALTTTPGGERRGVVAQLLRLGFLTTPARATFFRADAPSVYILEERPHFVPGGQDSEGNAWFVWSGPPRPAPGRIHWPVRPTSQLTIEGA